MLLEELPDQRAGVGWPRVAHQLNVVVDELGPVLAFSRVASGGAVVEPEFGDRFGLTLGGLGPVGVAEGKGLSDIVAPALERDKRDGSGVCGVARAGAADRRHRAQARGQAWSLGQPIDGRGTG